MNAVTRTIACGKTGITYELLLADRKSLEIAVHPDKRVVVKAPRTAGMDAIEQKVQKRVRWIKRQIAYFAQFDPRTPERRCVGGESHLHLGRKYRLRIEKAGRDRVLLKNGRFHIECVDERPAHVQRLLDAWRRRQANVRLRQVFDACWDSFRESGFDKPALRLQKMEKRWGSLSPGGRLTLNPRLLQAPRECIEYVIIHELCHLAHHDHGPGFRKMLDRTMPDWARRKHRLETSLA